MADQRCDQTEQLPQDASLSRRLLGMRFRDPHTERCYQAWRSATGIPFARIGYIGSAPSWAAFLGAVYLFYPPSAATAAPAIVAWFATLIVLTLLTLWSSARRWVMPLAALANSVAGFLVAWLLYRVVTLNVDVPVRAGIMTGGVLIVMYFGFAIFRIRPRLALAGVTPYLLFALFYLYGDFRAGALSLTEAGVFAAIQIIAYSGGVLVCVIVEVVTRRGFITDQIIQRQQQQLAASRDIIRRYVPPAVVKKIIEGDAASIDKPLRRRVTMLFCDIVGFTEIAERVDPETMTRVLGDYLSAMCEIIDEHGGTLNEFAGDGLMALFGAPDLSSAREQAQNSIRAAMAMQARIPELNASWAGLGLGGHVQVRIGINTGIVSVGSYGSPGRMTYTAVGLHTNIAARLEANAAPGSIWISEATHRLVQDDFHFTPQGKVNCKGLSYPVMAYAVMGAADGAVARTPAMATSSL